MQLSSALKLLAVATAAVTATAQAADCTSSELDQLLSTEQQLYSSSSCATITSDVSTATTAEVCQSSCMDYLSNLSSDFPDCEYYGVNLRTALESLLAECGVSSKDNAATAPLGGALLAGVSAATTLALVAA